MRCAGRRLESESQTAMQTSVLQSIPRMNARPNGSAALASAMSKRGQAHLSTAEQVVGGQEHQCRRANGAGEIADPYQSPGPHDACETKVAARPGHHHQNIASEDLCAAEQHHREAQCEYHSGYDQCEFETESLPRRPSVRYWKKSPRRQ